MKTPILEIEEIRDALIADRDQLTMLLVWNEKKSDSELTKEIVTSVKSSLDAKVKHLDNLLDFINGEGR